MWCVHQIVRFLLSVFFTWTLSPAPEVTRVQWEEHVAGLGQALPTWQVWG